MDDKWQPVRENMAKAGVSLDGYTDEQLQVMADTIKTFVCGVGVSSDDIVAYTKNFGISLADALRAHCGVNSK